MFYFLDGLSDNPATKELKCLHTLEGHIGSVRSLEFLQEYTSSTTETCQTETNTKPATKSVYESDLDSHCKYSSGKRLGYEDLISIDYKCSYMLFSCGSRTSLKCWRLTFSETAHHPSSASNIQSSKVSCCLLGEISSHLNSFSRTKKKKKGLITEDDDLRYMSVDAVKISSTQDKVGNCSSAFCLAVGCSDGYVR